MHVLALAEYLLATMLAWYPASGHDFTRVPRAETEARYAAIAHDLATVASGPLEAPLFEGADGRAQTALLMLSFAGYESGGFAAKVDQPTASGDGGHAWCLCQVHMPFARGIVDRPSCFRAGFRAMRASREMCGGLRSVADRLTGYTVGRCLHDEPGALLALACAM